MSAVQDFSGCGWCCMVQGFSNGFYFRACICDVTAWVSDKTKRGYQISKVESEMKTVLFVAPALARCDMGVWRAE